MQYQYRSTEKGYKYYVSENIIFSNLNLTEIFVLIFFPFFWFEPLRSRGFPDLGALATKKHFFKGVSSLIFKGGLRITRQANKPVRGRSHE